MSRKISVEDLLLCAFQVLGRKAIDEAAVREILSGSPKHVAAYNLCDGTLNLSQIAKLTKLDLGNFSKAITRWIQHGIVFWIGSGKDARLLHLYPIGLSPRKARRGE